MISFNGMLLFYNDKGYLDAINDQESGRTIAVLNSGVLIEDYQTEEAIAAIAMVPLFNPEFVTPPEPEPPDWAGFRVKTALDPGYQRIIGSNPAIAPILVWALGQVETIPTMFFEVRSYWNAIAQVAQPTQAEINALNAIAASCKVPLTLNEQGLL